MARRSPQRWPVMPRRRAVITRGWCRWPARASRARSSRSRGRSSPSKASGRREALELVVDREHVARELVADLLEPVGADAELAPPGTAHIDELHRHGKRLVVGLNVDLAEQLALHRESRAPRLAEVSARLHLQDVIGADRFQ